MLVMMGPVGVFVAGWRDPGTGDTALVLHSAELEGGSDL